MTPLRIAELQEQALEACDNASFSQKADFFQAAMLAEIALQLADLNEKLDTLNHWTQLISCRLDDMHMEGWK